MKKNMKYEEAVKKLDASRLYIDFVNFSEEAAKSACQKGKISEAL